VAAAKMPLENAALVTGTWQTWAIYFSLDIYANVNRVEQCQVLTNVNIGTFKAYYICYIAPRDPWV
jgi:hypothetical protein